MANVNKAATRVERKRFDNADEVRTPYERGASMFSGWATPGNGMLRESPSSQGGGSVNTRRRW